jgi:hypothetical protein
MIGAQDEHHQCNDSSGQACIRFEVFEHAFWSGSHLLEHAMRDL